MLFEGRRGVRVSNKKAPVPTPEQVADLLASLDEFERLLAYIYVEELVEQLKAGDKYTAAPQLLEILAAAILKNVPLPDELRSLASGALLCASQSTPILAKLAGIAGAPGRRQWRDADRNARIYNDDLVMQVEGKPPSDRERILAEKYHLSGGEIRTVLSKLSRGDRDPAVGATGRMLASFLSNQVIEN